MRCPDCSKFVSFDADSDPELDLDMDDNGAITGSARIVNNCAQCSTELTETTFDVENNDIADAWEDHKTAIIGLLIQQGRSDAEAAEIFDNDHTLGDFEDGGGSRTERYQDTDRRGKKIKSARYQTHYYGFETTATAKCSCGVEFEANISDEMPGSGMDELV